jgi:hypothetical protein
LAGFVLFGGKMENSSYFMGRVCGVLRADPRIIYRSCTNFSYVIVKDYVGQRKGPILNEKFNTLLGIRGDVDFLDKVFLDTSSVLDYYLKVHGVFKSEFGTSTEFTKNFSFTQVIFLEITSYLSAEAEYLLLMYKYLLSQRLYMPQLFVIIDYPTQEFDFIEKDILNFLRSPATLWDPRRYDSQGTGEVDLADMEGIQFESYLTTSTEISKVFINASGGNSPSRKNLCVIVSLSGLYEKEVKNLVGDIKISIHEDLESYKNSDVSSKGDQTLVLLDFVEKLIEYPNIDFKPNVIVFDPRFKAGEKHLYAGNIPVPFLPNYDYIRAVVWKLKRRFPQSEIRIFIEKKISITRGIFFRTPIIDYIRFEKYGVNMLNLYSNYYSGYGSGNFSLIIRSEIEVLRDLGYEENKKIFYKCVTLGVHPMIISLIESWFEKKLPRICILVFAAVILTYDKIPVEIKEHGNKEHENDISQTSRYGNILYQYLKLMQEHHSVIMEEGGKTSKLLKRLLDIYELKEEEMLLFDHNAFNTHLVNLIYEKHSQYILQKGRNSTEYTGIYNKTMRWRIQQSPNAPEKLFPITVKYSGPSRNILLFIPLDKT